MWTQLRPVGFQVEPWFILEASPQLPSRQCCGEPACLSSVFRNPVQPVGRVCADSKLILTVCEVVCSVSDPCFFPAPSPQYFSGDAELWTHDIVRVVSFLPAGGSLKG